MLRPSIEDRSVRLSRHPWIRICYITLAVYSLAAVTPGARAGATTFFQPCKAVLSNPAFSSLAAYLAKTGNRLDPGIEQSTPNKCFRLNDRRFLVLPNGFDIYDCSFTTQSVCRRYGDMTSRRYEMVELSREFDDETGKHFALLHEAVLEHGIFGEAYDVLYLVPPSGATEGRPYAIQSFWGTSVHGLSGDDETDPCGWLDPDAPYGVAAAVTKMDAFTTGIGKRGEATMTVRLTDRDCDSGTRTHYTKQYGFDGTAFIDMTHDLPHPNLARLRRPRVLTADRHGTIFVADGDTILKITPSGSLSLLAGGARGFADGQGAAAKFRTPSFLDAQSDGSVLVTDTLNDALRSISPSGEVTTLLGKPPGASENQTEPASPHPGCTPAVAIHDRAGAIVAACNDRSLVRIAKSGAQTILVASCPVASRTCDGFGNVTALAPGPTGELYVADHRRVVKVSPTGRRQTLVTRPENINIFATSTSLFMAAEGLAVAKDGTVYATSGNAIFIVSISKTALFAGGDAGFADGPAKTARFRRPSSLAFDGAGNLIVLDEGNVAVRKITASGQVTTTVARRRPAWVQSR